MDKVMALLFAVLTNGIPDARGNNVRSWWASGLNPPPPKRSQSTPLVMDEEALNQRRFQKCISLLKTKGLLTNPKYEELINSGTLGFLTQSSIQLRVLANAHAHSLLVNIPIFRNTLNTVKEANDDLCTDADFSCISGLLDFAEASNIQM